MKLKIAELYAQLQLAFPPNGDFFSSIAENFFPTPKFYSRGGRALEAIQYDVEQLTIDSSFTPEAIQHAYDHYKIIPLRRFNPDTNILIIGCGNYPLSDSGGNALNLKKHDAIEYRSEHAHMNAITLDPCMSKNPTIVGMLGWQPLAPYFKGKRFEKIVLEGVNLFGDSNLRYLMSDLEALLDPHGLIIGAYSKGRSLCYTLETFRNAYACTDQQKCFSWAVWVEDYFDDLDGREVYEYINAHSEHPEVKQNYSA